MASSPYHTTFSDWLQYLFQHPESEPEWYYAEGEEARKLWDLTAQTEICVEYLTQLFEHADRLLEHLTGGIDGEPTCLTSSVNMSPLPAKHGTRK